MNTVEKLQALDVGSKGGKQMISQISLVTKTTTNSSIQAAPHHRPTLLACHKKNIYRTKIPRHDRRRHDWQMGAMGAHGGEKNYKDTGFDDETNVN